MERLLQQLLLLLLLGVGLRAMAGTGSTNPVPSVIVMNEYAHCCGAAPFALAVDRSVCLAA